MGAQAANILKALHCTRHMGGLSSTRTLPWELFFKAEDKEETGQFGFRFE